MHSGHFNHKHVHIIQNLEKTNFITKYPLVLYRLLRLLWRK